MKSSSSTTGPTTSRKCWAQLRNSRTVCHARSVTRCVSVHSAMKACPSWLSELPLFRTSLRPKQSHRFLRPMTSARQTQMWKRSLRRQDEFILAEGLLTMLTSVTSPGICHHEMFVPLGSWERRILRSPDFFHPQPCLLLFSGDVGQPSRLPTASEGWSTTVSWKGFLISLLPLPVWRYVQAHDEQ